MILGRFYLKQTQNGNLLGEFSNYRMNNITTESVDLIRANNQNSTIFSGIFMSSWLEIDGSVFSDLEIQFDATTRHYDLTWRNNNGNIGFHGRGFLVDDILIGDYMDHELRNHLENTTNVFDTI
ncbi:hypothetical protein [Flavobacterium microcysteis]